MPAEKVTIFFEGKPLACRPDTSVAVALWENGIRHLSHSHKYGNHRGLTCARSQCTACLMRVDGVPNVRTCELPVQGGMKVETQGTGTVYGPPMQKMLSIGGHLFPVGFYYKWFTRPSVLSRFFLNTIRPMTGVGVLPAQETQMSPAPTADDSPLEIPATDLGPVDRLIVGAGPSGLTAALAASGQVLLVDDHPHPGGQRYLPLKELAAADGLDLSRFPTLAESWRRLDSLVEKFKAERGGDFRGGTRAIAGYAPGGLVLRQNETLLTTSFGQLTWAAGALDTLGLFPGNDTPGVLGPRALYRLLTRDGLQIKGKRVLLVGGGLDLWLAASLLAVRGAEVSLVVTGGGWQSEVSAAVDLGWQLTTGLKLSRIQAKGDQALEATFVPLHSAPGPADSQLRLKADLAVLCLRGKPVYDIPYQLGSKVTLDPQRGGFVPQEATQKLSGDLRLEFAGEAAGHLPEDFSELKHTGERS